MKKLLSLCFICLITVTAASADPGKVINLAEHFLVFFPLQEQEEYRVRLCADLPDNDNPGCVYKKKQPGHVFLILSKHTASGDTVNVSFGFYPNVPVTCLFKKVRSKILDNSNREYNACIEKKITKEEFTLLIEKSKELSAKKYDLKRFNCYEYALQIFNALPGIEKLPQSKVKFPFILGSGGSPCALYRDLKNLVTTGSSWTPSITFATCKSPVDHFNKSIAIINN